MKTLTLITLSLFIGCGTETGNPNNQDSGASLGASELGTYAYNLLGLSCDKLVECYSIDKDNCKNGILTQDNFDASFGLNSSDYSTFRDIIDAEVEGGISVTDAGAFTQCQTDINALACSDSEVLNAYDASDSGNYSNAYNLIPVGSGSCQDFY